ncbi:MAG: PAS domain S-box protein [Ferruginibacter sp.]
MKFENFEENPNSSKLNIEEPNDSQDLLLPEYVNESSKHSEEIGKFGSYNYSFATNKMFYSENFFKMLGCEPILHGIEAGFSIPYVHPDDLEYVKEFSKDIFIKNEMFAKEYRIIRTDGKVLYVKNDSKMYFDGNNNKWLTGIVRDITDEHNKKVELENALKTIKESEDHYHRMIEEVVDYAILFLDTKGNVTNWNKGAERIKGYSSKEIIGKNFSLFYPEEDQKNDVPKKLLAEALQNGRSNLEGWRVRKDGTKFWGNVVITAIFDSNQKLVGYSKVTRDLTEKKLSEDSAKKHAQVIEQKNIDLENMNKELQSFAYISSHDLQEPLRKINTFATLIMETDINNLSEKSINYFEKIQNASSRMRRLINDLLKYAHTKVDDRNFELTDIKEILTELHSEMLDVFESKNAILNYDDSCNIKIIPFQFKQLLANLLSNSLKFISPDRDPVITIKCKDATLQEKNDHDLNEYENYKKFTVLDNGIGFDPKYSEKVFKLMERLHGKNEYSGTGIGLSICKKIIENHHGIIFAEGVKGEGSTFTFFVPEL